MARSSSRKPSIQASTPPPRTPKSAKRTLITPKITPLSNAIADSSPPLGELVNQVLPILLVLLGFVFKTQVVRSFSLIVPKAWGDLSGYANTILPIGFLMGMEMLLSRHTSRTHSCAVGLISSVISAFDVKTPAGGLLSDLVVPNINRIASYILISILAVFVVSPLPIPTSAWLWGGIYSAMHAALSFLAPFTPSWAQFITLSAATEITVYLFCVCSAGALILSGSHNAPALISFYARLVGVGILFRTLQPGYVHSLLFVSTIIPNIIRTLNSWGLVKKVPKGLTVVLSSCVKLLEHITSRFTMALEWVAATYFTATLAHTFTLPIMHFLHISPDTMYNFRTWVMSTESFISGNLKALKMPLSAPPHFSAAGMHELIFEVLLQRTLPSAVYLSLFVFAIYYISRLPFVLGVYTFPSSKGPLVWTNLLSTMTGEVAWAMLVSSVLVVTLGSSPFKGDKGCSHFPSKDGFQLLWNLLTVSKCSSPSWMTIATSAPASWVNPFSTLMAPSSTGASLSTILHAVFILTASVHTLPMVWAGKGKVLEPSAWSPSAHSSKGVLLALAFIAAAASPEGSQGSTSLNNLVLRHFGPLYSFTVMTHSVFKACLAHPAVLLLALWAHKASPKAPLFTALAFPLAFTVECYRRGIGVSSVTEFLHAKSTLDFVVCTLALLGFILLTVLGLRRVLSVWGGKKGAGTNK